MAWLDDLGWRLSEVIVLSGQGEEISACVPHSTFYLQGIQTQLSGKKEKGNPLWQPGGNESNLSVVTCYLPPFSLIRQM